MVGRAVRGVVLASGCLSDGPPMLAVSRGRLGMSCGYRSNSVPAGHRCGFAAGLGLGSEKLPRAWLLCSRACVWCAGG